MHDPCYHPTFENCQKNSKNQPDGFECCSETPPKGKATFGLWVKNGTCDKTRGQCITKRPKDESVFIVEQIETLSQENYPTSSYLKIGGGILIAVVLILLLMRFKRFI